MPPVLGHPGYACCKNQADKNRDEADSDEDDDDDTVATVTMGNYGGLLEEGGKGDADGGDDSPSHGDHEEEESDDDAPAEGEKKGKLPKDPQLLSLVACLWTQRQFCPLLRCFC